MTQERDILVLGFGNPARGDDGLGPALVEAIAKAALPGVTPMWAYQPSVEHAADMAGHAVAVLADASQTGEAPFEFRPLQPRATTHFSTHALAPENLLALARDTLGWRGDTYLLAIRGYSFHAFEESLSARAETNLREAAGRLIASLSRARLEALLTDPPTDHTHRGGEPCQTATT